MPVIVEADDLFRAVGVSVSRPVPWNDGSLPSAPGVYVITVENPAAVAIGAPAKGVATVEQLALARHRWGGVQPIVYIGRSIDLRKRLGQFYAHQFGAKAPHAGGQSILLLQADRFIRWTTAEGAHAIAPLEHRFLDAFAKLTGQHERPFGNRVKAAQPKPKP